MCGIAGIIDFENRRINPADLLHMSKAVAHRGPDDEGYVLIDQATSHFRIYAGPTSPPDIRASLPLLKETALTEQFNIGLCHRRFSIIDLSSAGHQPFFDDRQACCAVFNGEIYNYIEIRDELSKKGVVFHTQSDTEALVEAYKFWGTDCFAKFNGFWAVAIFDFRERKLVLSRDHMGKKPLYWTRVESRLYFASEIKALLEIGEVSRRRKVNEVAVSDWLVYGIRDLDFTTCFEGIYSLPSACWAKLDASFPATTQTFWSVPHERLSEREISVNEASRQVRGACEDAVRIRLRSDVPISFELSGGLDSSAIVGLAAQLREGRITSYTVRFPEEKYNEEPFAREVAQRHKVDYRVLDSPIENFWCQILPFTHLQEEPYHMPNLQTSQVIWSQMRAAGTKVLLSGSSGDENFAGYGIYYDRYQRDSLLSGRLDRYTTNAFLDSESTSKLRSFSSPVVDLMKETIKRHGPESLISKLKKRKHASWFIGSRYLRDLYGKSAAEALYANMTNTLMPYWLRSGDKCVMGLPIEARCPFLDVRVIDLAFRLPISFLIRDGWRKWILRKAVEDILPSEVVWRKTKMGFPFPYERFLEESHEILETIFAVARNPFLDLSQKEALKRNWKAMSFILWYEFYFNDNVELFREIERLAQNIRPPTNYGYSPEYLRTCQPGPNEVLA